MNTLFQSSAYNKANQPQSLRSLDSLAVARFVHGFAIVAQNNQQQVCRCLRRYGFTIGKGDVRMNVVYRVLLIVLFFFAAIACYVFGVPAGGIVFLILGLIFEGLFWTGVFGRKKSKI
jgi:hypothetical protein